MYLYSIISKQTSLFDLLFWSSLEATTISNVLFALYQISNLYYIKHVICILLQIVDGKKLQLPISLQWRAVINSKPHPSM